FSLARAPHSLLFVPTRRSSDLETTSRWPIGYASLGAFGSTRVSLYCIAKASLFQLRLPFTASLGCPVERPDTPKIDKTCQQNCYENCSFDQARPAAFAHRDCPSEEIEGFNVEDHEEHRDQIEFGRQAQTRAAGREHAGFEGLVLAASPGLAAEQTREAEHEGDEPADTQQENSKGPVVGHGRYRIRHAGTP